MATNNQGRRKVHNLIKGERSFCQQYRRDNDKLTKFNEKLYSRIAKNKLNVVHSLEAIS